ncbi:MAG: FGLLP motif-containing membrane protein [Thermomicrobiales bacterium]
MIDEPRGGESRPDMFRSTPAIGDLSWDFDVLATNVVLAGISMMLLAVTAELFNKTVEENDKTFRRWFGFIIGPMEAIGSALHGLIGSSAARSALTGVLVPLGVLLAGGLIFAVAEPGAGLNKQTLVVMVGLVVTLGVLTYYYNGAQVFMSKRFGVGAVIQLFPVGVLFAVLSVALTRLDDIEPLVVYGFVAATVTVGGMERTRSQEGHVIFFPALALLGLCVVSWLLLSPFRDLAEDNTSMLAALPEAIAVGVLVGGLEATFIQMVPLKYLDGHKVWIWNKVAWVLIAGVTAFLLWEILLNQERDSMSAVSEGSAEVAIIVMGVCAVLSLSLYLFFRVRNAMLGAPA